MLEDGVTPDPQLGNLPADLILYDARYDVIQLESDILWNSLPAVKAGQVGTWIASSRTRGKVSAAPWTA